MSFSLQIANGDLVTSGSQLSIVAGADKLKQDMTMRLAERYGVDRFHPAYGSNLENYIGGVIGYGTQSMVYSEVMRVLTNYQKVQFQSFKQTPSLYSLAELLWSINNVNVGVTYDQVSVSVDVSNGQRQPTNVTVSQGTT